MHTQTTLDENMLDQENALQAEPAGSGKRLANMLLDTICYYIIAIVIFVLITVLGDESLLDSKPFSYLITFTSLFLYYTLMEGLTGKTIAKFVTRTRVVDLSGQKISLGKAAKRSLCRMIPFEAFSFLGGSRSGWHDTMTGTSVVLDR